MVLKRCTASKFVGAALLGLFGPFPASIMAFEPPVVPQSQAACTTAPKCTDPNFVAPEFDRPEAAAPRNDDFAAPRNSNATAAANAQSFAPNMIGDFFGTSGVAGNTIYTIATPPAGALNPILGVPTSPVQFSYPVNQFGLGTVTANSIDTQATIQANGQAGGFGLTNTQDVLDTIHVAFDPNAQFVSSNATRISGTTDPNVINSTDLYVLDYSFLLPAGSAIYVPTPGAAVGRLKLAENTSPMPRDRVFFGYSYFSGVPLTGSGVDVNRFSPGFEKTFFDRMMSIDVRFPFATTLSSDVFTNGTTQTGELQYGNMTTTFKALLWQPSNRFAVSAGLGLQLPTGNDTHVYGPGGIELLKVDDGSVHYQPFVGYLWTPNSRFFMQGFQQFDFESTGARVSAATPIGYQTLGRVKDSDLLYTDVGMGYWVVQNFDREGNMTGVAPIFEVHYNKSISHGSNLQSNGILVGTNNDNFDNVALTFGVNFAMRSNTWLTTAYVVPVGGDRLDRQMDGEFRVMLNRFFGPMGRLQRAQF